MQLAKLAFSRGFLLLMGLGLALLLGFGAVLLWQVAATRTYVGRVEISNQNRIALAHIAARFTAVESGHHRYLLTGAISDLEAFRATAAALPNAIEALTGKIAENGGDTTPLARLRLLAAAMVARLDETASMAASGDSAAAIASFRAPGSQAQSEEVHELVATLEAGVDERLRRRTAYLNRSLHLTLISGGIAGLLILGIAGGSFRLARRYTAALERAHAAVDQARASLEKRVAERTAELAAVNEEVQRFAYIVSHDLRAPLVNVMGFTSELETAIVPLRSLLESVEAEAPQLATAEAKEALLADLPEAIGFIRSATHRMDRLIGAILRLSREGRRNLAPEEVDLDALVQGIAASMAHQLETAGATLTTEGKLPVLLTDRLALEQVLANLIDNAVKYLDPARPGRITLRCVIRRGMATIEVEDNGRGIEPRDQARIFELFRRAGTQDQPGEGIGLAHVRALLRRLGGMVTCDSAPGEGSRFRVMLPLAGPPAAEKPMRETTP